MKNLVTQCVVILTFVCFACTSPLHAQLPASGDGAPELTAEASLFAFGEAVEDREDEWRFRLQWDVSM